MLLILSYLWNHKLLLHKKKERMTEGNIQIDKKVNYMIFSPVRFMTIDNMTLDKYSRRQIKNNHLSFRDRREA